MKILKTLFWTILPVLLPLFCIGQDEDSLIAAQLKTSNDIFRSSRDESDSLLQDAIVRLKAIDNSELSLRAQLMRITRMNKQAAKLREIRSLDSISQNLEISPRLRVDIKSLLARRLGAARLSEESLEIFETAMELSREHKLAGLGYLLISTCNPLVHSGDHFTAMENLLASLEIPGTHHGRAYSAIPNVCRKIQDWDNMILYGKKGLEDAIKKNDKKQEIFTLMQIAYAHMEKTEYIEARAYGEKAWEESKKIKHFIRAGILLTTLIKTELKTGNLDKALAYESELEFLGESIALPSVYSNLGLAKLLKGRIRDAIADCQFAQQKIDTINEQPYDQALYRMEASDCLRKAYQALGSYKEAFVAQQDFLHAKEIVEGKETFLSIGKALNQQELALQEDLLQLESKQTQEVLKERLNKYKLGGLLGFLLLSLGGFTLIQLRSRNKKIEEQNRIISKGLKEKDVLLKEIHHRVKNNLQLVSSLLSLQGRSIDDVTAQKAIKDGQSRIRSMALIHQNLYSKDHLTGISVKQYIEMLTEDLFRTYRIDKDKISLNMEIEDIELDIDILVPFGLIINELITNSLKYAFPNGQMGIISVRLHEKESTLQLQIEDNGIGYDPSEVEEGSFGSILIATLCEQLGGKIENDMENGASTKIIFTNYT